MADYEIVSQSPFDRDRYHVMVDGKRVGVLMVKATDDDRFDGTLTRRRYLYASRDGKHFGHPHLDSYLARATLAEALVKKARSK